MLTLKQEAAINGCEYTHDYEAEALESYATTGNDMMDELQARFEELIEYDDYDDLGGICVYFKEGELVAFYDYENFRGCDTLSS